MASQATLDRLFAEFDNPPETVSAIALLLEEGATPAYIARHRRWTIGNVAEDRVQAIADRLHTLTEIEQRRAAILQQAEERGRRTADLEATLADCVDQDVIDDFYQSMRPRRRGPAMQAEEKGLMPLAMAIQHRQLGEQTLQDIANQYVDAAKGLPTPESVLEGVLLILADRISHDPTTRGRFRDELKRGVLRARAVNPDRSSQAGQRAPAETPAPAPSAPPPAEPASQSGAPAPAEDASTAVESGDSTPAAATGTTAEPAPAATTTQVQEDRRKDVFDFAEPIGRIPAGRMLALRRAEREGILRLELTLPDGRHRELLRELHAKDLAADAPLLEFYNLVFDQAAAQLQEYCGKDVRRRLKEKADREAVRTYGRNLRSQLLAPPLGHKRVLSLRTSSKSAWAVLLAEDGSVAQHKTLPAETDEQKQGSLQWLCELIRTETPAAIAVPHGRRQASSERLVAALRKALGETPLPMVVPVDEAASTIFATSAAGKKAIPGVEVGVRTAISLGRRLQDPLQELARMDVRTLGIGQTLDDVHQGMLQRELGAVTASCLAQVGCDLNTVTQDVLEQLPGLDSERAKAILDHRRSIGGFKDRSALAGVPGLGAGTVRNIAGFVRITGGTEPLDATPLHPEDYAIATAVAAKKGVAAIDLVGQNLRDVPVDEFVAEGTPRQRVIGVLQLLGRAKEDPRGELTPTGNEGVHSIADLHADRELRGRVANLTEFGAFVDLGIGQDGLVHISQIPPHRLRDPNQMLRVGEVVQVWVLHVDKEHSKIALSMHKPRHLQEGRLPTLGERMEQAQGRRPRRRDGDEGPRSGRFDGGRGERRGPAEPGQGGERRRFGGRGGPRGGPGERSREDRGGFGDRGFGERRGRGGPREQRVYTVEPAKEVVETVTHKGEVTSLASLRALLGGGKKPAETTPPPDEGQPK
ncbi:MAG: S1 RNA-binding domain-containing protein [Planctomycetes bacterium]|nr:S1 RNA-binding domain-containing protein [Planctomycetota bacterium]